MYIAKLIKKTVEMDGCLCNRFRNRLRML